LNKIGSNIIFILLTHFWFNNALADMGMKSMSYNEMISEDVTDKIMNGNSLMIVKSEIPSLMFESSKGIFSNSVTEKEPGIWWLILKPGVQVISISAKSYKTISDIRHNFVENNTWTIKVLLGCEMTTGMENSS